MVFDGLEDLISSEINTMTKYSIDSRYSFVKKQTLNKYTYITELNITL